MLPSVLIQILQELARQLAPSSIAPTATAESFLPDRADLLATLSAAAARTAKVTAYLGQVRTRWNALDADGTITKLEETRRLDQVMRTDPGVVQPLAGLPQNDVDAFHDLFAVDLAGENANRLGRDLMVGTATVAAVTDTAAHATDAILNLRRLDDVLLRVLAAKHAAAITSTGLEQVLAMYRTEGNLDAPPSADSLRDGIPSGTVDAKTSLNPTPDITHLVWLADPGHFSGMTDDAIREFALRCWFVQIGGLDEIGKLPAPLASNFMAWSSGNWTAVGLFPAATSLAAARTRWDNLLATLELSRPAAGGVMALMVVPRDPLLLISGVLQEAVVFQRRLGKVEDLLSGLPAGHGLATLTPGMSYLRYHAGVEQFQALLVSAVVRAAGTAGPKYAALRTAIRADAALSAMVDALKPTIAAMGMPDVLLRWPTLESWLRTGMHLALLGDFIESAPAGGVWNSWQEHRGNLSRYKRLIEYYGKVMA